MFLFFHPVMSLVYLGRHFWIRCRYADPSVSAWLMIQAHYSTDDGLRTYLLQELRLISVYMYLAMVFSLAIGNHSLHWITIV